jgi:hypothetical protein
MEGGHFAKKGAFFLLSEFDLSLFFKPFLGFAIFIQMKHLFNKRLNQQIMREMHKINWRRNCQNKARDTF